MVISVTSKDCVACMPCILLLEELEVWLISLWGGGRGPCASNGGGCVSEYWEKMEGLSSGSAHSWSDTNNKINVFICSIECFTWELMRALPSRKVFLWAGFIPHFSSSYTEKERDALNGGSDVYFYHDPHCVQSPLLPSFLQLMHLSLGVRTLFQCWHFQSVLSMWTFDMSTKKCPSWVKMFTQYHTHRDFNSKLNSRANSSYYVMTPIAKLKTCMYAIIPLIVHDL